MVLCKLQVEVTGLIVKRGQGAGAILPTMYLVPAQFRNCATELHKLTINLRQFEIARQIDNFQIALRNLQIAQIGKMRGTYIPTIKSTIMTTITSYL